MLKEEMPVVFIGHGSPLNAIEENEFNLKWKEVAKIIPKPKAILCISAHWLKEGTAVTAMEHPRTIHDFYGFPQELYKVQYKAKGSPNLAKQIKETIQTINIEFDHEWGLDHGTWSVLHQMYPEADIPTLQLSLDYQLPIEKLYKIGQELKSLRKEGVLIIGSGNLVHNLMIMNPNHTPYSWAVEFDQFIKEAVQKNDLKSLMQYTKQKSAQQAHPTNDHLLPLFYVLGAAQGETLQFFNEGIIFGSIAMRCIIFGLSKTFL